MTAGASELIKRDRAALIVNEKYQPKPREIPTSGYLCRAHSRFFARRRVPWGDIRDALVVVLLSNKRFIGAIGKAEVGGITYPQIVLALEQVRPWCCYLSAPERAEVVRIGTKGHAYITAELADFATRVQAAAQIRALSG